MVYGGEGRPTVQMAWLSCHGCLADSSLSWNGGRYLSIVNATFYLIIGDKNVG